MALGLPDDPTKQRRVLLGLLPILLLVAYWYWPHSGAVEEVDAMRTRLENLEARNSQARLRAPQSAQLEERLAQFERHIQRLEQLVPRSEEVSRLLNTISERADQIGVEVARFNPGATAPGPHYNRRVFEMTVLGSYHEVGRFLSEIGSLPRIVTPINLNMQPDDRRERDQGQGLRASFQIETYVLPEPQQATPANEGASTGA
ncbi:MAG: type 4a pilus biogenesis protein PilO [Gemmatimonadetes bacterium]|nr:type 4a pilus biogenesis protein PilO [Gemmatimonadota bacterium]NIQ57353.1 type 4a pilus biogenesis protein PilO [Gemmatimonadota bacterium]NIU77516.1 type 4a pilus biogenesis protein PilO [Gammaproteobacteria bacterium]NIX46724.1 type 4a pilus biogenesis protein PilO [Gemmatimonadota bacterium]NIY11072.1 type 4a pilus biogenesis protein PilO [Gemmatimonadota bacterium]